MKKILSLITILALATSGNAQKFTSSESWVGKMTLGTQKLSIGFTIKTSVDNKQICTMDVPEQGAKNIPVTIIKNDKDSLHISIAALRATYKGGKISAENINGTFTQNGISLALNLQPGVSTTTRPQTPQPPFKYTSEEVVFSNKAERANLSGTLTYPVNFEKYEKGSVPIVLMITGSGAQNRDEELFDHKPFLVIADYLAKNGIASLRYDDRGVGKSTGPTDGTTTLNNLADAKCGIEYLRSLNKFGKIGVLGHSEGGTIAFMLGADKYVDFIVSLAASATNGIDVIVGQNKAVMQQQGVQQEIISNYTTALQKLYKDRVLGKKVTDKSQYIENLCLKNKLTLPDNLKGNLEKCITYGDNWLTWFLGYNPRKAISKTKCPVIALNGNLDLQVLSKENLTIIKKYLPKNNKNVIKEYDNLNHLFQHCTPATAINYGAIEETISQEVLNDITNWINNIKVD